MVTNDNQKCRKVPKKFCCESCDYFTSHKSHYTKHLSTDKHKMITNDNKMITKVPKSAEKCRFLKNESISSKKETLVTNGGRGINVCACGREYKFKSGLSRHKLRCKISPTMESSEQYIGDKEIVTSLIKENHELKNIMLDTQNKMFETHTKMMGVLEKGTHVTNSHNKTFNIQLFLNNTCKDAMNITDFVNNLKLQLSDLEQMGEIGYVNGITNIIARNLKDMDVTSRPIHCTDIKREILYIKDEDKWDKEINGYPKVRNVIKHVAHKNSQLLNRFKEKYPDYNKSTSKISDQYNRIFIESMGGKGDNDIEKENKIIKNLTKEVILEKDKTDK